MTGLTERCYLEPRDDMLVLLPLLDLIESPLFTTFFPWIEKLLSMYSSSASIVLGKLWILSLGLGTSKRLPRKGCSPPWDALRVKRVCWGMSSCNEDCLNFKREGEEEIEGEQSDCVMEQYLGSREITVRSEACYQYLNRIYHNMYVLIIYIHNR